ncbi:MAG: DUF1343 domain-containing protein [Gammaproteobacteria bacterium]|nr:DUF1343 domain-containing protein [Gammaproteobacteria bacterium]MCW5582774.1 DUF1343 domain-containing protein [Gammaproteobacteria bacterium]
MKNKFFTLFIFFFIVFLCGSYEKQWIQPGAEQTDLYFPILQGKRVGLFVNQSSLVGKTHLVDVLRKHEISVTKIFVPEHGFRGNADDGDKIENSIDPNTSIPIISLYGKKVKPSASDLENVDILLFDIQDVGVRFYTFISSLQRLMEAAIENDKPLVILDRPNPNGFYVDGPVLNSKSFTGLQPIPIVYGMTMGEYAKMLVGEQWLAVTPKSRASHLQLTIIPNVNYTHKSLYEPPIKPSPNLPSIQSIYLYPSIGLMEGTIISVGRGTDKPFQIFGHPKIFTEFTFIPLAREGAGNPLYHNEVVHGWNLAGTKTEVLKLINSKLQIKYFIQAYQAYPDKNKFFPVFKSEASKKSLAAQIQAGMSEEEIRKSWEPALSNFKKIRKKYLIYPDFE